ncbi:MAG: hypothetical protein HC771_00715 [Synechococcales cyanobacterium CRU_2_2]|nr:hypothetical protein [Synechococcales cyanobacterium CRU_2_2]
MLLGVDRRVDGAIALWAIFKARLQTIREQTKAEVRAERAAMLERLSQREQQIDELRWALEPVQRSHTQTQAENTQLQTQLATAETRLSAASKVAQEKLALPDDAHARLADTFKALSADALHSNNQSFLSFA